MGLVKNFTSSLRVFQILRSPFIEKNILHFQKVFLAPVRGRCTRMMKRYPMSTFLTTSLIASRSVGWFASSPAKVEEPPTPDVPEPTPETIAIEESDKLYHSYEILANYNHLLKFKDCQNEEILWRLARAMRDVSHMANTSKEDKRRLAYEALEVVKRGLEINGSNYACHKWYAICLSDVGDYEGTKQKISNAFLIRDHFEKAIELNPKDATSIHLVGLWCYTFAEMPYYQKKIAALVFAEPPSSTYEEALKYFEKAESVDPNFYSKNLLYLGKTYEKVGNKKMAMLYLQKAIDAPARKEEERETRKQATELMKRLVR